MMKMKKYWVLTLAMSVVIAVGGALPAVSYAATAQDIIPANDEQSQTENEEAYNEGESEINADEQDLSDYIDQLVATAEYEQKAFDAMAGNMSVTSANRKSLYLKFTNTVVPNYTKYVSKLKQIKPANPKLQKIHAKLIKGSYTQLEGYILYKRSFSKTTINKTLLKQGNVKVEAGKKLIEQYQKEFNAYASTLGYE